MASTERLPSESMGGDDTDSIDRALGCYLDRLNAGDRILPEEILLNHPRRGDEILAQLEAYVGGPLGDVGLPTERTLGDFTLRRVLGRGGMGIVYDAWQTSIDRRVALKVLPAVMTADSRAVARFLREAQAAGKLSHPNIVPVHFVGLSEGAPYFAMEYVEGETLASHLATLREASVANGRLPGGEHCLRMARAFAGAATGLEHAHESGVIHRDLKPSNLMLAGGELLRILDFGLARLEGQEAITLSSDFLGTPLYMSPEQARRKSVRVDHRTDIYSLGATLYEALTLEPPHRGRDTEETLTRIAAAEPRRPRLFNPKIPGDLETIVLQCLRKDPAERYPTAAALAEDLRRFAAGEAIEARPPTGWERTRRWLWRRRRGVAVAIICLVAAGISGVQLVGWRRAERLRRDQEYVNLVERAVLRLELASPPQKAMAGEVDSSELLGADYALRGVAAADPVALALGDLDAAFALDPGRPDARYHRARALLYLGSWEDANQMLDPLIEATDPGKANRWFIG